MWFRSSAGSPNKTGYDDGSDNFSIFMILKVLEGERGRMYDRSVIEFVWLGYTPCVTCAGRPGFHEAMVG